MGLTPSFVNRSTDVAAGDAIKTLTDAEGKQIQAMALVGESAEQLGGATTPIQVQGTVLTSILSALQDVLAALGLTLMVTVPTFANYQYMGSQTVGGYDYLGYKEHAGTGWTIKRLNNADDGDVDYAYSSEGGHAWAVAWGSPAGESYSTPPDS